MTDWPVAVRKGRSRVGVVLVHDITGLDATNLSFADKLNAEGFWVAAVDLFRGRVAKDLQEGMALRGALQPGDVAACLRAGLDALRREAGPSVKIGSMGFCMGGGAALEGACASDFAFCVDYYGMMPDARAVASLKGPLLLILASEDDRINPWAYSQLLPAADEHRKRVRVELYPGVAHAFHRPGWPSHDAAAAGDAWARTIAFLREQGA